MKSGHRKRLLLFLLFLSTGIVVGAMYQKVRKQELNQALIAAIKQNNTSEVISLLAQGADPNASKPLFEPPSAWEQLRGWFQRRSRQPEFDNRPSRENTALLVALAWNENGDSPPENVPLIRALLDAGATVNVAGPYGMTPLMGAAIATKRETTRLLLARGARIDAKDNSGVTVLDYAAAGDDPTLVRMLLAHGIPVNARSGGFTTPLHMAALYGRTATVRLLIESGGRVNARNSIGATPLEEAAKNDHLECVRLLLANGAQPNLATEIDFTPMVWARANRNAQMIQILKKAGAKK